jgi:hypothetical protein
MLGLFEYVWLITDDLSYIFLKQYITMRSDRRPPKTSGHCCVIVYQDLDYKTNSLYGLTKSIILS